MGSCSLPLKEIIVARFEAEEDLLLSIKRVVAEYDVKAGMFAVIGAVDRAHYGFYIPEEKAYTTHMWEPSKKSSPALEILNCTGNVAILDNQPIVHAHIMLSGVKGEILGGHLMEGCRVNPTGELTLIKAEGILHRKHNDIFKLAFLSI